MIKMLEVTALRMEPQLKKELKERAQKEDRDLNGLIVSILRSSMLTYPEPKRK